MSVEGNISKLYIIRCAKWFMVYMPIIGLFYADNGLTTTQIFTVQAAFSIMTAVFAIPSGYFADVLGRKITLILGCCLATSGFLLYATIHSFWSFFIAESIMGIGASFISGTDSAMLYDSLQQCQKQEKYLKYEGRVTSFGCLAETTAALIGGGIATLFTYNSVFWLQFCITAISIPASLLLVEPSREKLLQKSLHDVAHIGMYALFKDKNLSRTTLLSSITGIATLTMAWVVQAYFVQEQFSEIETTATWIILNLVVALASFFSDKLERILGIHCMVFLIIILIPLGYFAFCIPSIWITLFIAILFYFMRGFATPTLKKLIQNYCNSEIRATVLSVRDLLIRLGFAIIGPTIGYFSDTYTFRFALLATGILFSVTSIFSYLSYLQLRKYEQQKLNRSNNC